MDLAIATSVSDIASLWALALVLVILILAIMFYRPIKRRIERGGVEGKWKDFSVKLEPDAGEQPSGEPDVPPEETPQAAEAGEGDVPEALETPSPAGQDEKAEPTFSDVVKKLEAGDVEEARELFDSFWDDSEESPDAAFAFLRLRWTNDASTMSELTELAEDPTAFAARNYLALAHEYLGNTESALENFRSVAQAEDASQQARTTALVGEARCLDKLGRGSEAVDLLGEALSGAPDDAEARAYYLALAAHYMGTEEWFERALALEKVFELDPMDQLRAFEAGYSYAQADRADMALLHYRAALRLKEDDAAALNNMGVAYESLDMPIRAVESYKRSAELRHSLAAANLGNRYLNACFLDDARSVLEEASRRPEPHPNVAHHLSRALKGDEDEATRAKEIGDRTADEQRFSRKFAAARFVKAESPQLQGRWRSSGGIDYEFIQEDGQFSATFSDGPRRKKINGTLENKSLMFTVEAEDEVSALWGPTTNAASFKPTGKGVGLVGENGAIVLRFRELETGPFRQEELQRLML
jgi:tetratricopeptide (TPR) repeat protein